MPNPLKARKGEIIESKILGILVYTWSIYILIPLLHSHRTASFITAGITWVPTLYFHFRQISTLQQITVSTAPKG
jgi:hypothetical protein